jgi:hypothetical protein
MNQKTDGWEFYTDPAGRRHWRWPAVERSPDTVQPRAETRRRFLSGLPQQLLPGPKALPRIQGK